MKKAFFRLHVAVWLAGFTGILGKLITLNEGLLVWYRLAISSATLWVLFLIRKKKIGLRPADIWRLAGVGAVAALHWVSFYGSIKASNVSIALVCFSSIGFFTAILEPVFFRTAIHKTELLLGILVMIGIYFIFHFDPHYQTGIGIGLVAAILGSIFPILSRKLLQEIPVETLTLFELTGGFLFLSALMPFYLRIFPSAELLPNGQDWIWLLVLSWFCTVIAFNLSMSALKKISAFTVNLTYNLEPVYGIGLAFIVFREDRYLSGGFYFGFALIMLAILLQMLRILKKSKRNTRMQVQA